MNGVLPSTSGVGARDGSACGNPVAGGELVTLGELGAGGADDGGEVPSEPWSMAELVLLALLFSVADSLPWEPVNGVLLGSGGVGAHDGPACGGGELLSGGADDGGEVPSGP